MVVVFLMLMFLFFMRGLMVDKNGAEIHISPEVVGGCAGGSGQQAAGPA